MLIELLSALTSKEIRDFSDFVSSPFFNKNQSLIKLCNYLKLQHPFTNKDLLEKRKVFASIFPLLPYNDGFMRSLIFGLSSLAENYISYAEYKNSYYKDKTFLLCGLNDKKLNRQFEKNIKSVTRLLEKEKIRNNEYYYDSYNIENEKYLFYFRTKPDVYEKILKNTKLNEMSDHLAVYYYTSIISHYTRLFNLKKIYNIDFDLSGIRNIPDISKDNKLNKVPCLLVSYYELMLFVKSGEPAIPLKIKDLIEIHEDTLDKDQLYNIYINLINYFSRKAALGESGAEREVFELYKKGIEKNILPYHGMAQFRFYTTVTETAIKAGEISWADNFIVKFKNYLPQNIRENTYSYAKTIYEFATGDFVSALERLSVIKYNDVYHKLKCKCLTAMLYYELGYEVQLLSHFDAFSHFIMNDKLLNTERKKAYSAFMKYLKKIDSIRLFYNHNAFIKVRNKLEEEQAVYSKEWLLKKLNLLKK